jgi:hypothetical protein
MPLTTKWSIKISIVVLAAGVLMLGYLYLNSEARGFRVVEIKQGVVVETKLTGEQTSYQTYHASIAGYRGAAEADMYAYAEKVFSEQLREIANRDGKSQVWITFYLEHVVIDGQEKTKTFRIIYARDSIDGFGWHRLEKTSTTKI